MSGFHGTELDICLRDMGVKTVIPTGVSANMGIVGTSIEAVNHGYRLVLATWQKATRTPLHLLRELTAAVAA